jgi:very-short-patch-repair endonuclease
MAEVVAVNSDSRRRVQPARRVAQLAGRQGGAVADWQLLRLGFGRAAVDQWLRSGRTHSIHRGVYAVGHAVLGEKGRLWAALLACGPVAVISHRSAAALWGIRPNNRKPIDVTVPGRSRHRRKGIDVHLVRHLDPRDVTTRDGIPVTTVARTLLDLAEVVPPHHVPRAIAEADYKRLFDLKAVEELLSRSNGRRGQKPLTAALADVVVKHRTRSELERDFLQFCQHRHIPLPKVNVWIGDREVDMAWPERKLIVELDGYASHRTRRAFEGDRRRDAAHLLLDLRTLRVTDRWLSREPDDLERTVKELLARRALVEHPEDGPLDPVLVGERRRL